MDIETQHGGLVFVADVLPYVGARYARLDLERRRVVSWHTSFITPKYSECGSHKEMRKTYEKQHGKLTHSGVFPFEDGKLFDCYISTQKKTYVNSLYGGQQVLTRGRKYDENGKLWSAPPPPTAPPP